MEDHGFKGLRRGLRHLKVMLFFCLILVAALNWQAFGCELGGGQ